MSPLIYSDENLMYKTYIMRPLAALNLIKLNLF